MVNRTNYTDKAIFVGIDVHKKTYSVSVVCDNELVKRDTMPAYPAKLLAYLNKFFSGAHIKSAYEAGFSGLGLHRYLVENGIENIVVHAASIEVGSRDRVKTDKRDSTKIAIQLSAKRLKGIYIPSLEMEDRRELTRLRSTLVKDRNRIAARLKQKANFHGLVGPCDSQRVCNEWIKNLLKKNVRPNLRYVIEELTNEWLNFSDRIKAIDKLIKEQACEDEEIEQVYRSVKGIGPTSARVLANELGNLSQFSSERALFSYTGFTPCEYSSGEHIRRGHISRQGKPILRCLLVQCAWIAIRFNEDLKEVYDRIASRAGAKKAIVAVARRLIGKVRACFRKGVLYKSEFLTELKKAA